MKKAGSNTPAITKLMAATAVLLLLVNFINTKRMAGNSIGEVVERDPIGPFPTYPAPTSLPVHVIAPLGDHSLTDRPDDFPGQYQIHILYVTTKDFNYTTRDLDGSINEQIRLVNEWFFTETDGKTLRFDTYDGELDITLVVLPITEADLYSYLLKEYGPFDPNYHGFIFLHNALEDWLGHADQITPFFSPGKLFLTYFESSLAYVCGDGPATGSRIIGVYPSAYNLRDKNECKAFLGETGEKGRGVWEHILAHEIIHALGSPASCAKNMDQDGVHINDPLAQNDIMGTNPGIYDPHPVIDPNHNDYYLTEQNNCSDLADSPFLEPPSENLFLPENVLVEEGWRLP